MGAWVLLALQVAAPWTMPAQASWPVVGGVPLKVEAHASSISMGSPAPIDIVLTAVTPDVRVSPFLQPTRGIAFRVTTLAGDPVAAAEPMMGSPPPPPLEAAALTPVSTSQPLVVHTREQARTIFPGPGIYRLSTIIHVTDWPADPVHSLTLESPPIVVTVTR